MGGKNLCSLKMDGKRYFVLRTGGKDTEHIYTGRNPHQAALKAASDGNKNIELRERGAKKKDGKAKIHVYKGEVKKIDAPANAPDWLPAKVKKPRVEKSGIRWQ